MALEVRGLTKAYDGVEVVHDVSLDLRAGELGVILGRSGSGKSTLLMAAGGWLRPDAGSIETAGRELVPPWRRVAYVAQRFALLPELSVLENVELPLRLAGAPRDGTVAALLAQLDLAELAERRPHETSIGQQQRAALARALVLRPAVLLADEPTSHQDAESASACGRCSRPPPRAAPHHCSRHTRTRPRRTPTACGASWTGVLLPTSPP